MIINPKFLVHFSSISPSYQMSTIHDYSIFYALLLHGFIFKRKSRFQCIENIRFPHSWIYYILDLEQISHLIYSGVSVLLVYFWGYRWWKNPAIWLTTNSKKQTNKKNKQKNSSAWLSRVHPGIIAILGMTDIYDHIHMVSTSIWCRFLTFLDVW